MQHNKRREAEVLTSRKRARAETLALNLWFIFRGMGGEAGGRNKVVEESWGGGAFYDATTGQPAGVMRGALFLNQRRQTDP